MSASPGSLVDRRPTPWLEVFVAALPAALHAVFFLGRLHPDEIFQALEPALQHAFGFGVQAWEWRVGLRNQSVPIFFSWLLRAAHSIGIDDVWWRRVVLEVPQFFLHAAMLGAVWRFSARRLDARLARWCLWLTALYGPIVWFGGRTMSESFSVAFLVWGIERLDDTEERGTASLLGGVLLGLAVVTRYGSAAVVAPAMLWLLLTRRFRTFSIATAGGLVVAALLGALDRFTWGDWFHSFRAYVTFNVLTDEAATRFGAQPFWLYLGRLLLAPWGAVGLLAWRGEKAARAWLPVVAGVGYFLAISATAHKEDRFIYPTLVLLSVAGTPAFVAFVARRWEDRRVQALLAAALLGGLAFFVFPTPWDPERKEQFQLEALASRTATGLVILNEGLWGTGGFFFLGRNIPWCQCDFPNEPCFAGAMGDQRVNRGIYWSSGNEPERDRIAHQAFESAGFHLALVRGHAQLFERNSKPPVP